VKDSASFGVTSFHTDEADEIFAAWFCVAVLMVMVRAEALFVTHWSLGWLPIASYQDIVAAAIASGLTAVLLALARGATRGTVVFLAWVFCLAWAAYTLINGVIFGFIRTPLTLHMLLLSEPTEGARAMRVYITAAATPMRIAEVIVPPILIVAVTKLACRFAPNQVTRARRVFASTATVGCLIIYFLSGSALAWKFLGDATIVSNPQWVLASSLFAERSARLTAAFPADYLDDFRPPGKTAAHSGLSGRLPAGTNVVIVVMESVGAQRLQLCGARYHDSPELLRLSAHAVNFTRAYASMPGSSNAVGALLCSIYPSHGWQTITGGFTDLQVPSLASVLTARRYRAAFVHPWSLAYDHEGQFLRQHSFEVIEGNDWSLASKDDRLVDQAIEWIGRDRDRPFLLVLWTNDTHWPYTPPRHMDFGQSDPALGRYLDAIASTDTLIARLTSRLEAMGLGDDTVLAITGDHGEAFWEHGQRFHSISPYEEEVRIPLMLVSKRLFSHPMRDDVAAQQIDLAPTLLDLLGYEIPAQWQGRSLFSPARTGRVYLFANQRRFRLGFAEGNLKYLYDCNTERGELYALDSDPHEQQDLINDPSYASFAGRARQRMAAWLAFQDSYLEGLTHRVPSAPQ
jgi:lipoteichoic acid synthase